ncbi:MAG: tryptophan-rich sensory protein [Leptolinea sp.]|nr:tryptophan-rich sensory protein [Leptolinea sp.]
MKDIARQVIVILSILATLVVNTLANALPINGLTTGDVSDRFNVYFVPAGYVFSIWGLIYLGLIAYGIFQALPAQRDNPRLRATGWWVVLGGLANSAWIFLWHYEQFPLTLIAMFTLLVSLIMTYLGLKIGRGIVSKAEFWAVRIPFSVYLGWITVATVANVTSVLDFIKWDRFGLSEGTWLVIMLIVVLAITAAMLFTRRDAAFTVVILWALEGIAIKFASDSVVTIPTWTVFGLIVLALGWVFLGKKRA